MFRVFEIEEIKEDWTRMIVSVDSSAVESSESKEDIVEFVSYYIFYYFTI